MSLPSSLADVVHHALEAVEGGADLHHAQLQGAVADLLHQLGHQEVLPAGRCLGALREQVDVGAGDHQLADQVDQLVELVGLDADERLSFFFCSFPGSASPGRPAPAPAPPPAARPALPPAGGPAPPRRPAPPARAPAPAGSGPRSPPAFRRAGVVLRQRVDQRDIFGHLAVGGSMRSSQSSRTKSKTSAMAALSASDWKSISNPR
jgi:hypothetical protein